MEVMLGTVFIESLILGSLPGMWFQVLELTIWGPEPEFALRGTQRYEEALFNVSRHVAGCQNHGPVLPPHFSVAPSIRRYRGKETIHKLPCR